MINKIGALSTVAKLKDFFDDIKTQNSSAKLYLVNPVTIVTIIVDHNTVFDGEVIYTVSEFSGNFIDTYRFLSDAYNNAIFDNHLTALHYFNTIQTIKQQIWMDGFDDV